MRPTMLLAVLIALLPTPAAHTEPVASEPVGDVREPIITISASCVMLPCAEPGQPGAYVFTSDRPRPLGAGVYQSPAEVWVPPGASTLTLVREAIVSRRTVPAEMTLASSEFADGAAIPARFSCDGDTPGSPALDWGLVPQGTAELAVVAEDPDTPFGTFVHWVMYGIDPSRTGLAEGEVPPEAEVGSPWRGPCPPPGDPDHRYIFTLYAASEPTGLGAGASVADLRAALTDTLLDQARLTGMFGR